MKSYLITFRPHRNTRSRPQDGNSAAPKNGVKN